MSNKDNTKSSTAEAPAAPPEPPAQPPVAAAGPKKTVEEWATAKGMFHEFTEGKRPPRSRPKAPAPLIHNPKFVHFHRARRSNHWAPNEEMTEVEFDAAVEVADSHVYR